MFTISTIFKNHRCGSVAYFTLPSSRSSNVAHALEKTPQSISKSSLEYTAFNSVGTSTTSLYFSTSIDISKDLNYSTKQFNSDIDALSLDHRQSSSDENIATNEARIERIISILKKIEAAFGNE
jgi:hypothetical protein